MNDAAPDIENGLKTAENRLALAINRLETALAGQNLGQPEDGGLQSHVQELLRENNELRSLVSVSVDKLDGAIGQFKTLLAR